MEEDASSAEELDDHEAPAMAAVAEAASFPLEILAPELRVAESRRMNLILSGSGKIDVYFEFRSAIDGPPLVTLPLSGSGSSPVVVYKDQWYRKKNHQGTIGVYVHFDRLSGFHRLRARYHPDAGLVHRVDSPRLEYYGWVANFEADVSALWVRSESAKKVRAVLYSNDPDGKGRTHLTGLVLNPGQERQWVIPTGVPKPPYKYPRS